ncbi:MAG: hypothetical protein BWK78_08205 [Thiotrichaceae bacterium IS1]|nr:MAG: hypothetical protein BWK78_08205 [Thiotrichaceae bacterium IS1]
MRNIPASDMTQFLSELATLLQSNHSCQEALTIIQYGQDNQALLQFIATVHSNVKRGHSLADSLARYPQYVEPFLVTMLHDEENLVTTLFKIVEYREAMAVSTTDLADRLRTSLNYFWAILPILLILVTPLLLFFIIFIIQVFPIVAKIVVGFFPAVEQWALTLSEVFVTYWWLFSGSALIVGGSALIVGGWWWIRGWWWIQRQSVTLLHVPLLGRLYRKMVLVRFLRTCAFMLSNNASLAKALQASVQAVNNPTYVKFLQQLRDQVAAGATLAEALLKQPAFPAEVVHAAAIGTQVNQLDKQFIKLAEVYTQQLHQAIEPTIKSLNLIAIISIEVLVGWFVLAVYSPFFNSCQDI